MRQRKLHFAERKAIAIRKDQPCPPSISRHPFRRKAAALARSDVPIGRIEHSSPRAPRLRRVINAKASLETRSFWVAALWQYLAQQVAMKCGVVGNSSAKT